MEIKVILVLILTIIGLICVYYGLTAPFYTYYYRDAKDLILTFRSAKEGYKVLKKDASISNVDDLKRF